MPSVIVFTKDRPLQLHGYLESLLHHSEITQENISILLKENAQISYKKVKECFPRCNWIIEHNFNSQLRSCIENAQEFIMFGCDDVIIKNNIDCKRAENILTEKSSLFGFSFRLGSNIKPSPKPHSSEEDISIWNWKNVDQDQYNYPWELDCTLYRRKDILSILNEVKFQFINPNFFESLIAEQSHKLIMQPELACFSSPSQGIVITINRVQNSHLNYYDEHFKSNIFYLSKIYNYCNSTIDISRIKLIPNNQIHVGKNFFLIKNSKSLDKIIFLHLLNIYYYLYFISRKIVFYAKKS